MSLSSTGCAVLNKMNVAAKRHSLGGELYTTQQTVSALSGSNTSGSTIITTHTTQIAGLSGSAVGAAGSITGLSGSAVGIAGSIAGLSGSAVGAAGSIAVLNALIKSSGSFVATATEVTASAVTLTLTGVSPIKGAIIQKTRSGSILTEWSYAINTAASTIVIRPYGNGSVVTGDVNSWIAW